MRMTLLRRIIHDPLVLGGRWHVAGTTIPVGEVRLDHAARATVRDYAYPGLSAEELAACLAFPFPATRDSSVFLLAGVVVIACACGEDTSATGTLDDPIRCVCGRVWLLRLVLDLLQDQGTPVAEAVL
jgi:uncharacterized protein (DUF433 family)